MALFDTLKTKYGEYEDWRKKKVAPVTEPGGKYYVPPGKGWEYMKEGLMGVKEGLAGLPGMIKKELAGLPGAVREMKVGIPGKEVPAKSLIEKFKAPVAPSAPSPEEMKAGHEEWGKSAYEKSLEWAKRRQEEITKPWMKEAPTPTPELPGGGLLQGMTDWHRRQMEGLPGLKEKLSMESLTKPEGGPQTLSGLLGEAPGWKPTQPATEVTPEVLADWQEKRAAEEGAAPPTTLETGMKELGMPGAPEPGKIDVGRQTIGITDPTSIASIQKEMESLNQQLDTARMLFNIIPGKDLAEKQSYENILKELFEGGASAEDAARIIDNLKRAPGDRLSSQVMDIYKKIGDNPDVKKAKSTLEDLYTKYSAKEADLNSKTAEAEEAVNAIKQSQYLTQSMIVGRVGRMRDEYNMEISRIQNELKTLGGDIDRGRDALKTLNAEGFKMAEMEIGALELGRAEDILGLMPFSYGGMARYLQGAGQPPVTIGPGRFGWTGEGYEQVTPFPPATPTAKEEVEKVSSETEFHLKNFIGEGGFVDINDYNDMKAYWCSKTMKSPVLFDRKFSPKYLSPHDKSELEKESPLGELIAILER